MDDGAASKKEQVEGTMVRIGMMLVCLVLCPAAFGLAQGTVQASQNSPSASSAAAGDLDKIIAQLNAASAKFKSAQADFSWDQFQAVVQQDEIQTGTIYFERRKD